MGTMSLVYCMSTVSQEIGRIFCMFSFVHATIHIAGKAVITSMIANCFFINEMLSAELFFYYTINHVDIHQKTRAFAFNNNGISFTDFITFRHILFQHAAIHTSIRRSSQIQ